MRWTQKRDAAVRYLDVQKASEYLMTASLDGYVICPIYALNSRIFSMVACLMASTMAGCWSVTSSFPAAYVS